MRYNLRNVFSLKKKMFDEKFFNKIMLLYFELYRFFYILLFIKKNLFILQSSSNWSKN